MNFQFFISRSNRKEAITYLVGIKLYIYQRHSLVNPAVAPCDAIHGFRNIFKDKIQVNFFLVSC